MHKKKKENKIENKKENKIENKKENIIENKKENKIENKKENIIENKKENIIENKRENKIEDKIENKKEKNLNLLIPNFSYIQFLKNITTDSFCKYWNDNTFVTFKSLDDIFYIIYTNKFQSIISLDLFNNKKINEIKNAHNQSISNFQHFSDEVNNRDLIISLSHDDNNLKLWNINNLECLIDIKINEKGLSNAACFLNYDNNYYIITSNNNNVSDSIFEKKAESIKIFDFNGNKIKELDNSNYHTFFIDTYYDKKLSKIFIITGNDGFSQSYDYKENKIYYKYCEDKSEINYHMSIIIDNKEERVKMIESSCKGIIRIWDFHSAQLLNRIIVNNEWLYSICLWKKDYLFVGCKDSSIKLIELNKRKIIKNLYGHKNKVLTLKIIMHTEYGECLISQDGDDSEIKLWKISE